jgi:hypothetical protein
MAEAESADKKCAIDVHTPGVIMVHHDVFNNLILRIIKVICV